MGRREKLRNEMLEDIKAIARRQMAENGTASVSLSAIARELEVSQPALYRYYSSRDELVTALIVDAFNSLSGAMENADANVPQEAYAARIMAVVLANRDWALKHPVDFQLIYGNPIPGYHAPGEVTIPAARRGFSVILRILNQALQAGAMKPRPEHIQAAEHLAVTMPGLDTWQMHELPPVVIYFGIKGWTQTHGMIMLELYHHTTALLQDPGTFYQNEVKDLLRSGGFSI